MTAPDHTSKSFYKPLALTGAMVWTPPPCSGDNSTSKRWERRHTMDIVRIGLDLAKTVFLVHCVGSDEQTLVRKTLRREAVVPFFAQLPPCLVGMEACSGAHFWARTLSELGHEVRLISPQFVIPHTSNRTRTIATMLKRFARPSDVLRCGLFHRNHRNNWRYRLSIASGRG